MLFTIIICAISIIMMFICILKFPSIKIKNFKLDTFFIPLLIGALILLISNSFDKTNLITNLTTDNSLNPLKILTLFICISIISISLDETGFFAYLASIFIMKYKNSQTKLFFVLYILISIITIFTSNDIVILTFTPFILYFSKKGHINPIPYLVMEFSAANTYSIILPIGNPTNIYLTSVFEIDFISYVLHMIIPALLIGISSLVILYLLFRKELKKEINVFDFEISEIKDKKLCIINLIILIFTTILLAISNYINIEMWLICLINSIIVLIMLIIYFIITKNSSFLLNTIKRVPYSLIPFILSMYVLISSLDSFSIFTNLGSYLSNLNDTLELFIYLTSSTISCNIVNNIPMTMMYSSVLNGCNNIKLIYATIIGSNIGAILSPIGALAGIMWTNILKTNDISYPYLRFLKNGIIQIVVLILFAFIGLLII